MAAVGSYVRIHGTVQDQGLEGLYGTVQSRLTRHGVVLRYAVRLSNGDCVCLRPRHIVAVNTAATISAAAGCPSWFVEAMDWLFASI